jgi:hypothetical protein
MAAPKKAGGYTLKVSGGTLTVGGYTLKVNGGTLTSDGYTLSTGGCTKIVNIYLDPHQEDQRQLRQGDKPDKTGGICMFPCTSILL